jgi:hypothetical protein
MVYSSTYSFSLEAAKVWLLYATATHEHNYIGWNSAHCLYSWNLVPNESIVVTPASLRGRRLKRIFNSWLLEDNKVNEKVIIRLTPEWIVRFMEPEHPSLPYHWERGVGTVALKENQMVDIILDITFYFTSS